MPPTGSLLSPSSLRTTTISLDRGSWGLWDTPKAPCWVHEIQDGGTHLLFLSIRHTSRAETGVKSTWRRARCYRQVAVPWVETVERVSKGLLQSRVEPRARRACLLRGTLPRGQARCHSPRFRGHRKSPKQTRKRDSQPSALNHVHHPRPQSNAQVCQEAPNAETRPREGATGLAQSTFVIRRLLFDSLHDILCFAVIVSSYKEKRR